MVDSLHLVLDASLHHNLHWFIPQTSDDDTLSLLTHHKSVIFVNVKICLLVQVEWKNSSSLILFLSALSHYLFCGKLSLK